MSRYQLSTLAAYSIRGTSSGSPRTMIRSGFDGSSPWTIAFS